MRALFLAAVAFAACAHTPPQTIATHYGGRRLTVKIADSFDVQDACADPGGVDDQGWPRRAQDETGGCYDPSTMTVWLSRSCRLFDVWRHEICHAISGQSDKWCDDHYPVECVGWHTYSQGMEHAGGKL